MFLVSCIEGTDNPSIKWLLMQTFHSRFLFAEMAHDLILKYREWKQYFLGD